MPPAALQTSSSVLSTASSSNKADLAAQREIEAIWAEVHIKVIELGGGDPKNIKTRLDINGVLGEIDRVQDTNKKKSEKHSQFKTIVNRTLQCISTIGGIVTDGVSNVFAPAGMCYNALTFVIQAWKGYEGIFENLGELLEKCVEFLERLESYEGRMDAKLARLACQNLRLFVEICDRTIKLRHKHTRLLSFAKQLFLNDDGIQGVLHMMERLNSKESLLVNAQTYKIVSDSAGDIKLILDAQKEQKKEDDAKKWRRTIAKSLGFPGNALDTDGEPTPTWQRAYDSRLNALVDDTGSWWKRDKECLQWTQSPRPEKSLLVLEGQSGTGKTSMMANAAKLVRRMGRDGPTTRVVTAYYFAEGDKNRAHGEEEGTLLERVSRTLLWQIATSYETMTRSVGHIVSRATLDGSLDHWRQLFVNNRERHNPDTTFYLFIDGIDSTLVPLLHLLTSVDEGWNTRIFLTAWPEMSPPQDLQFYNVPISERNGDDVEKYITYRMDNMPILKDTKRPGISGWRQTILNELKEKCTGDYFKLNTSLDALAKVDLIEDIREVLAEADKTRTDQIVAELRRLNHTRTPKEIKEINEIILWLTTSRRFFSMEMMEALLSVRHKANSLSLSAEPSLPLARQPNDPSGKNETKANATLTISLLPFAQKLRSKYTIFSVSDSGFVEWSSPEIKAQLPKKGLNPSNKPESGPAPPQVIQESEIQIVRHFLSNVCPTNLYERFEFEQFFQTKAGARDKDYISLDPDNAHIKIAITCLIILTEEELRSRWRLREYAMYWFLDHLHEADLSLADRELKAQIGPLLVKLLTTECGIDSLFWTFDLNVSQQTWERSEYVYLRESRAEWLYSKDGTNMLNRYFNDSSVVQFITAEPGASLVSQVKDAKTSAELHKATFSYAAKRMATHLFSRVEFLKRQFFTGCCFLRGYLARINPERNMDLSDSLLSYKEDDKKTYHQFEGSSFPLDDIRKIEAWCAEALAGDIETPEQQSLWEIHGALMTFQLCNAEDNATEIYRKRARRAIELNPSNWHACHFIAKQPNTSSEESAELLNRAKRAVDELCHADKEWILDGANSSLLARITLDLGNSLWQLGKDDDEAARIHRESLEYDYVHFKGYASILQEYRRRQRWDGFIAFMEALNDAREVWEMYFDELVNEFIVDVIFKDPSILAEAADATHRWDVVEIFFTIATDIGTQNEAYDLLFLLREGFARTMAHAAGNTHEDEVIAIRVSALELIQKHHRDTLSRHAVVEIADSLAEIYLDKAFRPGVSEDQRESLGSSIAGLLPDTGDVLDVSTNTATVCCLVRYHFKRKSQSRLAQDWQQRIVRTSLELLSDDDDENDDSAYRLLARLLTSIEDVATTRIAWNMRNLIQHEAQQRWEDWVTDPITSPIAPSIMVNAPSLGIMKDINDDSRREPNLNTGLAPDSNSEGSPAKPSWFVNCAGCDKQWTFMNEPLHTCADCVGTLQLCGNCHSLLVDGKLTRKGLKCKKEHKFIEIPPCQPTLYEGMPKGCVPLPDSKNASKRWITLDEFKTGLRKRYPEDETKMNGA
ncbi:hypothetical protein F5Y15DRAFT_385383 [Xylariaceae sp. FL0016]|nr:hypothetical protein F5Y15DRAFT_385383 [Xylariaceae sp. FL0016]